MFAERTSAEVKTATAVLDNPSLFFQLHLHLLLSFSFYLNVVPGEHAQNT